MVINLDKLVNVISKILSDLHLNDELQFKLNMGKQFILSTIKCLIAVMLLISCELTVEEHVPQTMYPNSVKPDESTAKMIEKVQDAFANITPEKVPLHIQ